MNMPRLLCSFLLAAPVALLAAPRFAVSYVEPAADKCIYAIGGINIHAQLAGTAFVDQDYRAITWDGSGNRVLIPLVLNDKESVAYGINDKGEIVGQGNTRLYSAEHGFIYDAKNGTRMIGDKRGKKVFPLAINNSGTVIGTVGDYSYPDTYRAFSWSEATGSKDLSEGSWRPTSGVDVNERGDMLLTTVKSNHSYAVVIADGESQFVRLRSEYNDVFAMNSHRQFVLQMDGEPFVWDPAQGFIKLHRIATGHGSDKDHYPTDINDAGQVVGWVEGFDRRFFYADAQTRSTRLEELIDPADPLYGRIRFHVVGEDLRINQVGQIAAPAFVDGEGCAVLLLTPVK